MNRKHQVILAIVVSIALVWVFRDALFLTLLHAIMLDILLVMVLLCCAIPGVIQGMLADRRSDEEHKRARHKAWKTREARRAARAATGSP